MKTPHSTFYRYTEDAIAEANKLPVGTVAESAHKYGMENAEPLLVAMDCMLRYARAYESACDARIGQDGVLGDPWLDAIRGIRALLNGRGAIAMQKDISTDTKDNGVIESLFWTALKAGGLEEKDL